MAEENGIEQKIAALLRPDAPYRSSPDAQADELVKLLKQANPELYAALPSAMERERTLRTPPNSAFSMEDHADFWRINGVKYRNGVYVVDLAKQLLDGGKGKQHAGWVMFSQEAGNNDFRVGSAPLHHAIFDVLYENRANPQDASVIEGARTFLNGVFRRYRVGVLSRVAYLPQGKDVVVHDVGMPTAYEIEEDIVGPDEWLNNALTGQAACKALVGADDLQRINDVYYWISGKKTYLWRVNAKPAQRVERVVSFGVYNTEGFDLYAFGIPVNERPALGVRFAAQNFSTGNEEMSPVEKFG